MAIRCLESGMVLYQGNSVTQYQKIALNKEFSQEVLRLEELRQEEARRGDIKQMLQFTSKSWYRSRMSWI